MKPIPRWLFIPPAVALLLILGPMTMQGSVLSSTNRSALQNSSPAVGARDAQRPAAAAGSQATSANATPTLPPTPGFWQMGSALIGVLLLGAVGIYGLRRMRGGAAPTRGTRLVTLRQTLRLTQRGALHAVEFDDRILLIGESERGLALIETAKAPEQTEDEALAAARATAILEAAMVDDDGAVPKNLLIPRPDNPARPLPKQPALHRTAADAPGLNDFRALLQKAGRA